MTAELFRARPDIYKKHLNIEQQLYNYMKGQAPGSQLLRKSPNARTLAVVTLPVVVHIIHNNGSENISDATVFTAIQHLNEAFANTGFYDPADGVSTGIQFCMAERTPDNSPTNGITRDVSPYTVMGGPNYYSDDQQVKNIVRWNPECYINIYIVKSIPGSVAGYAYLPSAHGSNVDGIVLEAAYFGSSYPNDVVIIHEMGHYMGLYHTFEGGCTNNDCTADGDKVCDTPPDQSTASVSCGSSMNSCSTDVLSGFATDQPDLTQDYMDYGNFNCMKVFTQGQSDRMNWFLQNVRSSLMHCKSCMPPCPAPVTAAFTSPGSTVNAGTLYTFVNNSVNAAGYEWRVNGVLVATTKDLAFTFSPPGNYTVTLIARSADPLCDSGMQTISIKAVCPVTAAFTKSAITAGAGTSIAFTNTSAGADSWQWLVNGTLQAVTANFSYTTVTAGTYIITLNATSSAAPCNQTFTDTVYFTCPVVTDFIPASLTTIINTPVTFTSTGTATGNYQWQVNGADAGTAGTLTYSFPTAGTYSVRLTSTDGVCTSVKNGVVYVADKCGNPVYLFRKNYTSPEDIVHNDLQVTSDGGSVSAGKIVTGAMPLGALMKMDASGELQWVKVYGSGTPSNLLKVKTTQDGGYISIGNIAGGGGSSNLFIVKTLADGSIEWSRQLTLEGVSSGTNIIQSVQGDYYFTGTLAAIGSANGGTDAIVGKLNTAGTLVWLNTYSGRKNEVPTSLADEAGTIIVCGDLTDPAGSQGFLLQLSKADGTVNWSRNYTSSTEHFKDVLITANGYFVDVVRSAGISPVFSDHAYLFTDASGNIISSSYISPFGPGISIGYSSVFLKPNGNIVSQTSPLSGGSYQDFLVQELDPVAGIVWSKTYGEPDTYITGIAKKSDNSFFLGGFSAGTPASGYLMSVDPEGNGGSCPANPAEVPLLPTAYAVRQQDWAVKQMQAGYRLAHTAQDLLVTVTSKCQYIQCDDVVDTCLLCNALDITGIDSVCGKKNTYIYTASRKPGCPVPVQWEVDGDLVNIVRTTDSTIELTVKATGSFNLSGTLINPCDTLRDTITIHAFAQPDTIMLGPDIDLCKQSTILLNAGSGFTSYLWQDGSTDSTLTAYFPGEYIVNAFDYCGNKYADTLTISQAPDVPFDLGPDTTICLHDSLQLSAPAGFTSYLWSPVNYAIDDPYSRTPVVFPGKDTVYTCTALKYVGCTYVDTIRITVLVNLPANFLDSSATYCLGSSIELMPSGTFNQYAWSNGETTSSITVSAPGNYALKVTDNDQCSGLDTIVVKGVECLKGIHFPNAFTPDNDGHNDVFKAIIGPLPVSYLLVIYNRWGEKVFETNNPLKGWDGIYKGKTQATGGFVWYAVFRFRDDEKEQKVKGIVMLVR